MTLEQAKQTLKQWGVTINKRDGEYRVNYLWGAEESAYYTDSMSDAFATGKLMGHIRLNPIK